MKLLVTIISFMVLALGGISTAYANDVTTAKTSKAEIIAPKSTININTADAAELTRLKGIGVKKAEAIVAWRNENGNFKAVDDLLDVKGIGEATLEANREIISL